MDIDKNQGGKRQAALSVQARTYASIMGGRGGKMTGRCSKVARPEGILPMKGAVECNTAGAETSDRPTE